MDSGAETATSAIVLVEPSGVYLDELFHSADPSATLPIQLFVQRLSESFRCPEEAIHAALDQIRAVTHPEDPLLVTYAEGIEVARIVAPDNNCWSPRKSDALLQKTTSTRTSSKSEWPLSPVGQRIRSFFTGFRDLPANVWGSFRKSQSDRGVYNRMKPTTRLVLTVLVMSLVIALAVAGTGVGLAWTSSMTLIERSLEQEARMVVSAVESYSLTQAREQALANQFSTGLMLADMIQEVGYTVNLQTTKTRQLTAVRIAAKFADSLFMSVSLERVLTRASIMKDVISELCLEGVQYSVVNMTNQLNSKMNAGQETVLFKKELNGSLTLLSDLRYRSKCPSGVCSLSTDLKTAMDLGINQKLKGSLYGVDYLGNAAFLGYSPIDCANLGMVSIMTLASLQSKFLAQTVAAADSCNSDDIATPKTTELIVANKGTPGVPMTVLLNASACPSTGCYSDSAAVASVGNNGTAIAQNYRNEEVLAVSMDMPYLNATVVLEIGMAEIKDDILTQMGISGTAINKKLNGSLELILGKKTTVNGTDSYSLLTTPKFQDQCGINGNSSCGMSAGTSSSMVNAAVLCNNGASLVTDYRGQKVLAAYVCAPKINAGLVYKIDNDEIIQRSVKQAALYANDQNTRETTSMELAVGKATSSPGVVQYLSNKKYGNGEDCLSGTPCLANGDPASPMLEALAGHTGLMRSNDYRGTRVITAFQPSLALATGFVLKSDVSEAEIPLIKHLFILLGTALGITLLGMAIIGFSARHMLNTIEDTWQRGKLAVQKQKEGFERLVSALYPKFASERLLAGDVQIVVDVPKATIFFSDICNFTALSNQLAPTELLEWIGYTFRVMDSVAEHYKIYKIKTIGDAYLAISGLPSSLDQIGEEEDHTFRMVQFAANVVQIFSGRYVHPDAGDCLKAMAAKSVLLSEEARIKGGGSLATTTFTGQLRRQHRRSITGSSENPSNAASAISDTKSSKSSCPMRFGIALGPVIAGVLHGACPQFDIWGKTVNLAARMEHTGRAGHIQCTEGVFHAVGNDPRCLLTWEKPHTTFAKGFGNIPAYFMRSCDMFPPKELMLSLGLEPKMETYFFDGSKHHEITPRVGAATGAAAVPGAVAGSPSQPSTANLPNGVSYSRVMVLESRKSTDSLELMPSKATIVSTAFDPKANPTSPAENGPTSKCVVEDFE